MGCSWACNERALTERGVCKVETRWAVGAVQGRREGGATLDLMPQSPSLRQPSLHHASAYNIIILIKSNLIKSNQRPPPVVAAIRHAEVVHSWQVTQHIAHGEHGVGGLALWQAHLARPASVCVCVCEGGGEGEGRSETWHQASSTPTAHLLYLVPGTGGRQAPIPRPQNH